MTSSSLSISSLTMTVIFEETSPAKFLRFAWSYDFYCFEVAFVVALYGYCVLFLMQFICQDFSRL